MLINPLFLLNLAGAYFWLAVVGVLLVAVLAYSAVLCVQLWNLGRPALASSPLSNDQ